MDDQQIAQPYSIGWPSGFKSRTTDPSDKCFVGSKGAELRRSHAPTPQSQAPWADPTKRPDMQIRLRVGTNKWRVYNLLQTLGPLPRSAIACNLGIKARALDEATLGLVRVGALDRKQKGKGQSTYSVGKTVVSEVG